jgi:hypothetical protein
MVDLELREAQWMDYIALFVLYGCIKPRQTERKFMTASIQDNLRYWRTSLADGALGEGKFTQSDRKRFIEIPASALKTGVLPPGEAWIKYFGARLRPSQSPFGSGPW